MKSLFLMLFSISILSGCSSMQITERSSTGHFVTSHKAKIVKAESVDLDKRKSLLITGKKQMQSPVADDEFNIKMIKNIHYFDRVITLDDYEKELIQSGAAKNIDSLNSKIALHKAASEYKNFLILSYSVEQRRKDGTMIQMKLLDPITMEEIFIAETHMDTIWVGVSDERNWYPMYNALIDYIDENSKAYKK